MRQTRQLRWGGHIQVKIESSRVGATISPDFAPILPQLHRLGITRWNLRDIMDVVQTPTIQLIKDANELIKCLKDEKQAAPAEDERRLSSLRRCIERLGMYEVARRLKVTDRYLRGILYGQRKPSRQLAWRMDELAGEA